MAGTLLSLGHGYSARALAGRLPGWRVIATTRSEEKAATLRAEGAEALVWPGAGMAGPLAEATHLLTSVAPGEDGDPVLAALGAEIAAAAPHLCWAGYLSTTGVYGDHGGAWVDEETPPAPATTRGERRVAAERAWRALAARSGLPLHIFRLAGIYGPGRGPFAKLREGRARRVVKPGQVFSRIHVEDIAGALAASIARPAPGAVYNVCDDEPAAPQDVTAFAAGLLGMAPPGEVAFADAQMPAMARSFYAESKRVRNDRLTRDLGVTLRYPTFRDGLRADLAQEKGAALPPGASPR